VHTGNDEQLLFGFNLCFYLGDEIVLRRDSARFQRAGQCAGQSTAQRSDQVVDGRRHRLGRLRFVERGIAAVHAIAQRLSEAFHVGQSQRPFLLFNADTRGMDQSSHGFLPWRIL